MAARGVPLLSRAGAVVAAAGLVLSAAACANDAVESAEDDPFRSVAIGLCGELIDSRVHAVWADGSAASLRVLELAVGGGTPDPAEIEPLTSALAAYRDDFQVTVDALAELGPPDDYARLWATFVAEGTDTLAALDARLAALADWDAAVADVLPNVGNPDAVHDALSELGLLDRDCASVLHDPGPLEGYEGWVTRAAEACSVVAERRLLNHYEADADLAVDAFATVFGGKQVAATDELVGALERVAEEWQTTYESFAAVDPAESPAPDEWQHTIDYSAERAEVFAARAAAVADADPAAIQAAFAAPGPGMEPGFGDFAVLGLAARDCRSVQA